MPTSPLLSLAWSNDAEWRRCLPSRNTSQTVLSSATLLHHELVQFAAHLEDTRYVWWFVHCTLRCCTQHDPTCYTTPAHRLTNLVDVLGEQDHGEALAVPEGGQDRVELDLQGPQHVTLHLGAK